jgi:thiosulfate dehydrogenase [quinone] large subunit
MRDSAPPGARGMLEVPPARFLFRSTRASVIWLIVRLWLGWQWLDAGWQKATSPGYANWLSHSAGLQGFIATADSSWAHRAQAYGHPEVAYGWYVSLLNDVGKHAQVVSVAVTFSELAVGVGLLLGCLTGIAAAGGIALNLIYITSGSAGPNGVFILLGILLLAAWRVAGYLGADYFILPATGTFWQPGWLFRSGERPQPAAEDSPDQLEREAV